MISLNPRLESYPRHYQNELGESCCHLQWLPCVYTKCPIRGGEYWEIWYSCSSGSSCSLYNFNASDQLVTVSISSGTFINMEIKFMALFNETIQRILIFVILNRKMKPGTTVHACNSSNLGDWGKRIQVQGLAQQLS